MLYKIKLILLVLLLVMLPVYGICDWSVVKYDTVFGTTDKPVKASWGHCDSNQYHIEVRFLVFPTNSLEVTYNIYDGDAIEPTYTTIIDQTDIEKNDKWVLLGWYHQSFTGTIRVEVVNISGNLCIDAIRVSEHHCLETVVINNERGQDVHQYTSIWEVVNTDGYDGGYAISEGAATHTWIFLDLEKSDPSLSFEYYFQHVETGMKTEIKSTTKYSIEEMLPKSGHYIFYNRTCRSIGAGFLESTNCTKDWLIRTNEDLRCGVLITEEMTVEEIRGLMYESGKHSMWINSAMEEYTLQNDCSKKAFWYYGYIAPPGTIVIE